MNLTAKMVWEQTKAIFRGQSYAPWDDFWYKPLWPTVKSGQEVNQVTGLSSSTVYACITLLADTMGVLPLKLYQRGADDSRRRVREGPLMTLVDLFAYAPNKDMSAFRFKQLLQGHLCGWGNVFVFIDRDLVGRIKALWPLRPDRMRVKRAADNISIEYEYDGNRTGKVRLGEQQVWHMAGFGYDGLVGYSTIRLAQEAIGMGLAAEEFGARFFGQGSHMGVVIKHPKKLTPEARNKLEDSMAKAHSSLGKAHQLMVLDEAMEVTKLGIPPNDAQFLETRKFQVQDICRFFRIPPHMVQDESRSTFNNIEEQGLNFARHTINPWATLWASEMNRYFLTAEQRRVFYWELDLKALLKGDFKTRAEGYASALSNGWMNRDEVRRLENLNPMDGDGGKIYTVQLAMTDLEQIANPPEPMQLPQPGKPKEPPLPEGEGERFVKRLLNGKADDYTYLLTYTGGQTRSTGDATRRQIIERHQALFEAAVQEIVTKEINAVTKAAERNIRKGHTREKFADWLAEFYGSMDPVIKRKFNPIFLTFCDSIQSQAKTEIGSLDLTMDPELKLWVKNYTERFTERYISSSMGQIGQLAEESMERVQERMGEWGEKRAGKVARNETVRAAAGIAQQVFWGNGLGSRWVIKGKETCPYCRALDGKVVMRGQAFLEDGTEWDPGNLEKFKDKTPMKIWGTKHHPPLHEGCDCGLAPDWG